MIRSVLIANRGEIARRVIRTCKRLGIRTVAIYSDADAGSLHVTDADESISIGGYTPRDSYLVVDKVLRAAEQADAEAIHPGYGFLSENADFAESVIRSGRIFIGPSPEAIRLLGDKTAARDLAIQTGVPIAPGSIGAIETLEEAKDLLAEIGYPVIIKAAAGGGGKGMRIVSSASQLENALRMAQGEAQTAFNDKRVFIERFIQNPRHIEIQVLADSFGNVLYFPERECSIQRRHQKVIEESPSTAITADVRARIGQAASRLIQQANYTNAGTLEFLYDANGEFYFMEVNTRLQVEHPVTEAISGIDFVEQQLYIASGKPMTITQQQIAEPNGHAIECRICAEDVYANFLPDVGRITMFHEPTGEHIRNDHAVHVGSEITIHYDPMIAKLIVWAPTRDECIENTIRALDNYHLGGLKTTIPFCRLTLDSQPFRSGVYDTGFVASHWPIPIPDQMRLLIATVAAGGFAQETARRAPGRRTAEP